MISGIRKRPVGCFVFSTKFIDHSLQSWTSRLLSVILIVLVAQTVSAKAQNSTQTSTTIHPPNLLIPGTQTFKVISEIVGWIYFFAWSISFYPQIIQNYQRKSVRGLSFDFVFLNITGFAVYSLYNVGLYFFNSIKQEYNIEYPQAVIPVQLNDVVFSLHALFACTVIVVQCIIYDRGSQQISIPGKLLLITIFLFIFVIFIVAECKVISWLIFLTWCSYVKLVITLIKYMPQAYLNWDRKSTSGWCIGNVLLDFVGGVFSLVQMTMLAYIHNDWSSFFGDTTKFGLGLFSILFDIFFMVQHYILYRNSTVNEPTIPSVFNNFVVRKPKKEIEMVATNVEMSIPSNK